ncbi:MAG: urease accessory protein UreD [Paracoccaceae bacterium]
MPDASRAPSAVVTTVRQPRAEGRVEIATKATPAGARLARLRHQGSAKCLMPRLPGPPQGVIVNTAGGITGGDRFAWTAEAGPGAALTLTTQAAERLYRARPGEVATVATRLSARAGATLAWLPQETILYDRAAVERRLDIEMAADARVVLCEPLILGRAAMGETVESAHFVDRWTVRRAGRLVFADTLRLSGPVAGIAARPAVFGPHRAAASLLLVAPDAEDRLAAARAALPFDDHAEGGASAWDGMLAARVLARDGRRLRGVLTALLAALGAPLPRVWTF